MRNFNFAKYMILMRGVYVSVCPRDDMHMSDGNSCYKFVASESFEDATIVCENHDGTFVEYPKINFRPALSIIAAAAWKKWPAKYGEFFSIFILLFFGKFL